MRTTRITPLLVVAFIVAAFAAFAGNATTAEAAPVELNGQRTALITDPATTAVLIENGIVPLPVKPATVRPQPLGGGHFSLRYEFPITGGRVDSESLAGKINHSGGLRFVNLANWSSLKLTNFRIVTSGSPGLTAIVNDDPDVRVRILNLDLSDAEIRRTGRIIRIAGVDATLTQTAADALNATLGVSFFAAGIDLGEAYVAARVAR